MKNDTTRRYPRTLQAAFGPYTDSVIYEPPRSLFSWIKPRPPDPEPQPDDEQPGYEVDAAGTFKG